MASTLVTDTSVIYAVLDSDDRDHQRCSAILTSGVTVALPAPVITETCLVAQSRRNARLAAVLLENAVDGTLVVIDLDTRDYARIRELLMKYADTGLDVVDASVVAISERLGEDTIATLDRRHFSVVRPLHVEAFKLVP